MVAVPELPADASWYPWYLSAAGYFEATGFSAEDRLRSQSYAADAQRAVVASQSRSLTEHLASLEMVLKITKFDAPGRQRISQLINKTNQFNVTTRRYTEAEVANMEQDPSIHGLQVRLVDRFGDLGMIAVVICRQAEIDGHKTWNIDTWLMSCRVLGRKVEEGMLARLVSDARELGIRRLVAHYIPTSKNSMVKDLFRKIGFTLIEESATGERRFVLEVDDFVDDTLPFVSSGAQLAEAM